MSEQPTTSRPLLAWLTRLAWLPIPLLLVALAVLWLADLRTAHESQSLMMALNLVCSTLSSLLVAILVGSSFIARGAPELLLVGCGVLVWGAAGTVAGAALQKYGINATITIHNLLVWLAGVCFLTGAILSMKPRQALRSPGVTLALGYIGVLCLVGLVVTLALRAAWMPAFFVDGRGGTAIRMFVLSSSVVMFAFTAALLWLTNLSAPSAFVRWYGVALLLVATGLIGIMIETVHGGVLSWTGRAAQYLGGAYLLVAAVMSVHETGLQGVSLSNAQRAAEQRLRSLLATIQIGAWDLDLVDHTASRSLEHDRIFGYAELLPQWTYEMFLDHVLPEDRAMVDGKFRRAMETQGDWDTECRIRRADGQVRWIWAVGRHRPNAAGIPDGMTGIVQDITARKQGELALQQMNTELERRVAERTTALRQVNETLERRVMERAGEIQMANEELEASRKAAINLMDDAITTRQQAEKAAAELSARAKELRTSNDELERFNRAMVDRELRLIELKREVNELCAQLKQEKRYPLNFEKEEESH